MERCQRDWSKIELVAVYKKSWEKRKKISSENKNYHYKGFCPYIYGQTFTLVRFSEWVEEHNSVFYRVTH